MPREIYTLKFFWNFRYLVLGMLQIPEGPHCNLFLTKHEICGLKIRACMKRAFKSIILITCFFLCTSQSLINISFAANAKEKQGRLKARLRYDADLKYFDMGVKEVLSGDMIRLENDETLRLIGVNTPEVIEGNKLQFDSKISNIPVEVLKVMGNEAKCFIEKLIDGKRVRVEFDKKRKGNYGELLGYVFIISDKHNKKEVFLNAEVIKSGYTYKIDTTPNSRYMSLFEKLHGYAKDQSSQLWQQWQR